MKKNRAKLRKQRRPPGQPRPPKQPLVEPPRRDLLAVLWDHRGAVGLIGACFAVLTSALSTYESTTVDIAPDPQISISDSDLPFTAKNKSKLFRISQLKYYCIVDYYNSKTINNLFGFVQNQIIDPSKHQFSIEPNTSIQIPCMVRQGFSVTVRQNGQEIQVPVEAIKLHLTANYRTGFFGISLPHPQVQTQAYTWESLPGGGYKWEPGAMLNEPRFPKPPEVQSGHP